MRDHNIRTLQETLQIVNHGTYQVNGKTVTLKLTKQEMQKAQVLLPEHVRAIEKRTDYEKPIRKGRCDYGCENADSFTVAIQQYIDYGHTFHNDSKPVLVLNFANLVHPGGGVRRGARAQEEDLCRKSSLLLSLESEQAEAYYAYNRNLDTRMGSDAIILTPQVEIIRDEKGNLLEDTVVVSVLTCAAPIVSQGKEGMSEEEYQDLLYQRIIGMLTCAAYYGYDHLVLGAWGCGAFGNNARVISDLFDRALKKWKVNGLGEQEPFCRIDFAVLDRTELQYNYNAFYRNFGVHSFDQDENQGERTCF